MNIRSSKPIDTPYDLLALDIIDWNRLNGYWPNTHKSLEAISSWVCGGKFFVSEVEIENWGEYQRDDFPDWMHCGDHVLIGMAYWDWFKTVHCEPENQLSFSDSPDFYGQLGRVSFWGDIGKVSASAFIFSIQVMKRGDLWISIPGDGSTHIVLEALYSPIEFRDISEMVTQ